MTSRRVLKVAQAIREVVSSAIVMEMRDPRIADVTVTFVEVSGDMRRARVHVTIMGDDQKQQLCLHGLQHAAGYLQQKIANRIDTRYTPRLEFRIDEGVQRSLEVHQLLGELFPEDEKTAGDDSSAPTKP